MVPALVRARLLASMVARFTGDRIRIGLDSLTEPSLVSLSSADVTVTVHTLDDSFPAYRRLLPDTAAGTIQTDRAELLAATRRAAAERNRHKGSDGDYGQIIVTVTPDSVSVAPRLAEHADTVTAPTQPATAAGITDTVTLHTQTNATRPVLFTDTPDGLTDGRTFRHLLMPVHPPRN